MNFFRGAIRHNAKAEFAGVGGISLPLEARRSAPGVIDGRSAVYGIRPEHFTLADDGVDVEIQVVEPTGSETQLVAKLGGQEMIAVFRERHAFKPGDRVKLKPDPRLVHLFDEATGKRLDG
jgi:multiple sugar transport system ATP-binding protein